MDGYNRVTSMCSLDRVCPKAYISSMNAQIVLKTSLNMWAVTLNNHENFRTDWTKYACITVKKVKIICT